MSDKIVIKFQAKGDKQLVKAIERLALAQGKLENKTKRATLASDDFQRKQKLIKQRVERNSEVFGKLQSKISVYRNKLLLAAFAATAFSKTIGRLTSVYGEQEAAEKRLSTALGFTNQELLDFASAQQQITTFGDEVTISAMAQAAAFTGNQDAIKSLTVVSQDFASATQRDLSSSMDLIVKSVFSSTNALSRYGIEINNSLTGAARFNAMMAELNDKFGGQATAALNTYNGATAALGNAVGDLGETFGEALAETLLPFVEGLKDLVVLMDSRYVTTFAQAFVALSAALLVTKERLISLGTWMLGLKAGTMKTAGAMVILRKGMSFLFKGGLLFGAIEGVQALVGWFSKTEKSAEPAKVEIESLAEGVKNLKLVMAGFTSIEDAKSFKESLDIEGKEDEVVRLATAIEMNQDVLDNLNKGLTQTGQKWIITSKEIYETLAEDSKRYYITEEGLQEKKAFSQDLINTLLAEQRKKNDELIASKKDEAKVDAVIEGYNISAIKHKSTLIPNLQKEVQLLQNKKDFSGAELELQNLLTIARAKDVELTRTQIGQIEALLEQRQALNDQIAQQTQITSTINSMSQAFSNFILQTNTGLITWRNFGDLVVGQIQRILAQILALRLSITALNALKINVPVNMASQASGAGALLNLIPGVSTITNIVSSIGSILGFHNGGLVPTSYHSGGEVPAVLQSGEYVMSRSAVDAIGIENLNSLNAGGSAQNVTINVTGNVMSQDFVEGELMQSINNAIRKGFVLDNILEGDLHSAMAMKNLM